METTTLEARISQLEDRIKNMEKHITAQNEHSPSKKRGWQAIVGIHANNPRLEEAERLGREWRFADSPDDAEDPA